MIERNVELVREVFRLFDADDAEGARELWRLEARVVAPENWPEPGPVVGRDAVMDQFQRLRADAAECRTEVELLGARDEWVVVAFHWHLTGERSGIETVMDAAAAFRLLDGQIAEAVYRWDPADALAAAGLGGAPGAGS